MPPTKVRPARGVRAKDRVEERELSNSFSPMALMAFVDEVVKRRLGCATMAMGLQGWLWPRARERGAKGNLCYALGQQKGKMRRMVSWEAIR